VVFYGIAATGVAFVVSVVPGPISQVGYDYLQRLSFHRNMT